MDFQFFEIQFFEKTMTKQRKNHEKPLKHNDKHYDLEKDFGSLRLSYSQLSLWMCELDFHQRHGMHNPNLGLLNTAGYQT